MAFGVFQDMVPCFNRGRIPLSVMFDGQSTQVPVGPCTLPSVVVNYAKNQHPVMGSVDPNNPSISGGQYLIGVVGKDNCDPLDDHEWNAHCDAISRLDLKTLMDDRLQPGERVEVRGRGRKTQARGTSDTGVRTGAGQRGVFGATDRND